MTQSPLRLVWSNSFPSNTAPQYTHAHSNVAQPAWAPPVMLRMQELVRLEPGWDGYRACPVSFEVAHFAVSVLERICSLSTPAPQIVPGRIGDVQLEWHTPSGDIEIWVRGANNVSVWCALDGDAEGNEYVLSNDFSVILDWVRAVTEPVVEAAAA